MAEAIWSKKMTVTVTEFQKNFSLYEELAVKKPVTIINRKTGVSFVFSGQNPMQKRLERMRAGHYSTQDKAERIAVEQE